MSRLHDMWDRYLGPTKTPAPAPQPAAQTITIVTGGGTNADFSKWFNPVQREQAKLKKYREMYEQGGIVSSAFDMYPLFILSNGWRLESQDKALKQTVKDALDLLNFDEVMWDQILDAALFGDSMAEIVPTKVDPAQISKILVRDASEFSIKYDQFGEVSAYEQNSSTQTDTKTIAIEPARIMHLQMFRSPGQIYGLSLMKRAFDEINRDVKLVESITEAMVRHGFPKYQVVVGDKQTATEHSEDVGAAELKDVAIQFQEFKTKTEFVTGPAVEVKNLDTGGLTQVDKYSEVSIQRLCAAINVPRELLQLAEGGLGSGGPSARIQAWYDMVGTLQKRVARQYTLQVIDRISGKPGMVKLVFNEVDTNKMERVATWLSTIMKATPMNPFAIVDQDYCKKQLGIETADPTAPATTATVQPGQTPARALPNQTPPPGGSGALQ